jgi:hypothetical protein
MVGGVKYGEGGQGINRPASATYPVAKAFTKEYLIGHLNGLPSKVFYALRCDSCWELH